MFGSSTDSAVGHRAMAVAVSVLSPRIVAEWGLAGSLRVAALGSRVAYKSLKAPTLSLQSYPRS